MDDTKKMILGIAATVVAIIAAQIIMRKLNILQLQKQEMQQHGSDLYQ